MELHYYLFASYLFMLALVLVLICKYLFADVKRQRRMLDEKEKQLLSTFRSLEDMMDDYYALVDEAKSELENRGREIESRLLMTAVLASSAPGTSAPASEKPTLQAAPQRPDDYFPANIADLQKKAAVKKPVKSPTAKLQTAKTEVIDENQIGFEQLFNDAISNISAKAQLHEKIVEMSRRGQTRAEIAKTLKITQNEVELVTGMHREPSKPIPINILEKAQ